MPDRFIKSLDHVQLAMPVGEEDAAIAFYEGVLGFRHVPKPEPLAARGGCWFESGTVQLHLGTEDGFRPARKAHPAFHVGHFDELTTRLAASGVEMTLGSVVNGIQQHFIHDVFGNRIELLPRS